MALSNIGFENTEVLEDIELDIKGNNKNNVENLGKYIYEDALDITGEGIYNKGLLITSFMIIIAMGIDIFGLGIIVTAATCDLGLTLSEISTLSSMPFAGIIFMSYPWGYISDTRGRKLALMWAMSCSFLSALLSSLAPNWQTLAALRFISSAMSSAAESATYALLGECCTSKVRARYLLLITSALMLTPTLYYVAAYFITKLNFSFTILGIVYRPWRLLTLIMALPLGIGALMLYFFHESPKYLVNVGRNQEAVDVLYEIYMKNNKKIDGFPVKQIYLEEGSSGDVRKFSLRSLWTQIAPIFQPPLLWRSLLLFYLTFVIYIANNSFAIILPTIFNLFFTSYATSATGASFCDLFILANTNTTNTDDVTTRYATYRTFSLDQFASFIGITSLLASVFLNKGAHSVETHTFLQTAPACEKSINDNTIWAGCAHGLSFFLLNALISQCAHRRKVLTITILVIAAAAALGINNTGEPISGLVLFFIFLTTAMVFGVVSSYFVDLYPTSYRGMVACLGMMVARLSAFAGTNIVGAAMTMHCSAAFYGASVLVLSGALAAVFLPTDKT